MIGQRALHNQLAKIPDLILDELRPVLEQAATELVRDMRALVNDLSGALSASIGWTWGIAPKGAIVLGSVGGSKFGILSITIYAGTRDKNLGDQDAFYARWVEFGTTLAAAHPYFFPAFRANQKRIKAALSRGLKRAMKKGNRK